MAPSTYNYKSCPLKKRPIVYVADEEEHQQKQPESEVSIPWQEELPQDLSLKRKASASSFEEYSVPAKRGCVLNLSKSPEFEEEQHRYRRPVEPSANSMPCCLRRAPQTASSAMLSPNIDDDLEDQPTNIHMRGITAATTGYSNNPYQSAFVTAAGCNPMPALWTPYQSSRNISIDESIFPSPASSVASSSYSAASHDSGCYGYPHMTPPSSPGSEASSEDLSMPEDLSLRSDIPLTALFFMSEGSSSYAASSSDASYSHYTRGTSSGSASDSAAAAKNYRFKCEQCQKMYSTLMGLSKHQQFHCPAAECNQEKKQHACEECGKLYTTIGALKMHIRTHTLPCKCPICGKAFSRPWLLQGHIRTHTGEKPFQCPDCPRSFADRSNLRAHQQTHVEVKKYACKVCHKSFSRMSLLNKHANSSCTITIV